MICPHRTVQLSVHSPLPSLDPSQLNPLATTETGSPPSRPPATAAATRAAPPPSASTTTASPSPSTQCAGRCSTWPGRPGRSSSRWGWGGARTSMDVSEGMKGVSVSRDNLTLKNTASLYTEWFDIDEPCQRGETESVYVTNLYAKSLGKMVS